jgi:universal stress protein A
MKKIVFCTDFSENAEEAFAISLEMAEKFRAKLYIVHVLPPVVNPLLTDTDWVSPYEPVQSFVSKIESQMRREYGERIRDGVDYEFVVLDGHISTEILKYLEENQIDIVIMGSYGLSGVGLVVFGSVAKRVAHKAVCSVMIVRKPGTAGQ